VAPAVIESGQFRQPLPADEKRLLLERLSSVEAFEEYLRRAFLGQKQFSIEGLDVLVPMLDEAVELAARDGAHEVVLGMAHRGRLSVLAHTFGQPYEAILQEFEGERTTAAVVGSPEGGTGDVKYHLGAEGVRHTEAGDVAVTLVSNPSHLGQWTRSWRVGARRADRPLIRRRTPRPVGGAAGPHPRRRLVAGQGVVAETFHFEGLAGY
jgi:2-oxoglutarate dehydrogenase E1 component